MAAACTAVQQRLLRAANSRQGLKYQRRILARHQLSPMSSSAPEKAQPTRRPLPLVELREYELRPESVNAYLKQTSAKSELRASLAPLRLFTMPETGGALNVATHLYHWAGGYEARNDGRAAMSASSEWRDYLKSVRGCMARQRSSIFVEAPIVSEFEGVCGLEEGKAEKAIALDRSDGGDCIYELRRYKLKLGYDAVPSFLRLYGEGLPSKLTAEGTDPSTSLITLLYSEVGMLNEVVEIWRHGGGTAAMERSRMAARSAPEWRKAIGEIAGLAMEFTSTIHRPVPFSPLR